MTQPLDFAAIAARANANGIMVTACGVKEIAGMLAPQSMPQAHDALREAVQYIERYGLMPAEKRRAARAELDALATDVPAAPQPSKWRDKIASIVARAYGGSLYPGFGVPGDYPVEDVDYRAADAIGEYLAIVRQAVPPHSIAAIAAAWQRVVNALNDVPGGMHAELEDAASSFDELAESLLAPAPPEAAMSTGYRCLDSRSLNGDAQ
jgi:DNA-directed RNA polymerase subunit F